MGIGDWADGLLDGVDRARRGIDGMFEPVLRLGVTGLSRAGKTVFITAFVASLLDRGRMRLLKAEAEGRILAAMLQPQPDAHLPRFAFEEHLAALLAPEPRWPESTRQISQLRISLKVQPSGMFSWVTGVRTIHIDIVDYPGEWLLDLPLLEKSFAEWSAEALKAAEAPARVDHAQDFLQRLSKIDPAASLAEPEAAALAADYRAYLAAGRKTGLSALAPGRFLMPGDMEGSPALTFAPLPRPERPARASLWREFERRYEAYKRHVVRPFFREQFARLDRQVVLVDALGALAAGPRALADLTAAMAATLTCFRHGENSWLDQLLGGRRIEKLLFVASKADHLHHEQHQKLTELVEAMLAEAARRATYHGAKTGAMAIAAIRASSEQSVQHEGREVGLVRGRRASDGKEVALFPGTLPEDVPGFLAAALAEGAGSAPADWPGRPEFARPEFAPPGWSAGAGNGPPHIRLDRAIEFLIGDRLE